MMHIYTYVPHTVNRPYAIIIVLITRIRNCLPFASTWVHLGFRWGSVLLIVLVFCVVYLFCLSFSCVLCTQWCQFLLTFPVSYVPNGASFSRLSIFDCPFNFSLTFIKWALRTELNITFFIIRIPEFVEHRFQLWMKTTNYIYFSRDIVIKVITKLPNSEQSYK